MNMDNRVVYYIIHAVNLTDVAVHFMCGGENICAQPVCGHWCVHSIVSLAPS